ncbi:similar to Saccharomyces cerevisiae YGR112W SHY1 Mitochondrial inner membrane protein required for assembly of cytochrome c oxidase (complex IV) [Maudiozyma barnettii]|uniref:SURF1-like protein n=1 Tax=Maudiozyma barnettii TaxID=61262 RepID=A0A8H2VAV2_9SACH|nr:Shy1p [Kazachstania barnettii]CAB4251877.1 similar to Saccharomyces cerevisiae YGR112W SHY1 Mitochondrial inner membrane protein required for assembly of cytochrome c oxidase (complex IV) [Kazachstania barnettii]CAD1778175.1 similar to Saccharomyces cerevisiae YGR112W SHY1 Mitochondrial inner membrane protein required for assembly of cytochrome c oxidase (complex IV) [Kazachstania barnettii]
MFLVRVGLKISPRQGVLLHVLPKCRVQNASLLTLGRRSVVTSTIDWNPIKTHHNPNDKEEKRGSFGKNIVLGLMIAMPIISFYLGTWQLRRLEWKTKLVTQCETKLMYDPIPLPKDFSVDMCEDWEYRKVRIRGHFLHDEERFVGPRSKYGEKAYVLYTPFVREDTGEKLLVERGWISEHKVSPDTRTLHHLSLPTSTIDLICLVRPPKVRGSLQWEQNDKNSRLWQVADIYAIADTVGCKPINFQALYDLKDHPSWRSAEINNLANNNNSQSTSWWKFWQKRDESNTTPKVKTFATDKDENLEFNELQLVKAGVPIGKHPSIDLRNNHLQYLVTWYGLSLLSTIFLVVALKKYWLGGVVSQSKLKSEKLKNAKKYM